MTNNIHKSAIIENSVTLGSDITVGAFCHVKDNVTLGNGVILESHVVIGGNTKIGDNTHIFPFASIGLAPQDLKFNGEETFLEIGKNNIIREHVTINPGTKGGGALTKIGDNCLFMVASHIAHDCIIGNNVILANNATVAGHVHIGDNAIIGGLAAIHQFVRIGAHAMVGGMSGIESDVIPYGSAIGERAGLAGLNIIGLKRRGFKRDEIHALRNAYKVIFGDNGNLESRVKSAKEEFNSKLVDEVLDFIKSENSRSLCTPKK